MGEQNPSPYIEHLENLAALRDERLADGFDAAHWRDCYRDLTDAIDKHLPNVGPEDGEEAESFLYSEAIRIAGERLAALSPAPPASPQDDERYADLHALTQIVAEARRAEGAAYRLDDYGLAKRLIDRGVGIVAAASASGEEWTTWRALLWLADNVEKRRLDAVKDQLDVIAPSLAALLNASQQGAAT